MPDTMLAAEAAATLIRDAAPRTRFLLRGDRAVLEREFGLALPQQACRAEITGERAALWLGPDEWLLLAPAEARAPAQEGAGMAVWDGTEGAAFDVGHRQLGLEVTGRQAAALLATECPLDIEGLPDGFCSRTVFGKAEIVLWRLASDRFHVETWRSFAVYLRALLSQSARGLA